GPGLMGILVACFALGQCVGYPLCGPLLKRTSARTVLGAALVVLAAGDLGLAFGGGLGFYFASRALQGVGAAGLWMGVVFGVVERDPAGGYRRLGPVLSAYAVGGLAGPGFAAAGGIRSPFLIHLGVVGAAGLLVLALGTPEGRPRFTSERAALRQPGFLLSC